MKLLTTMTLFLTIGFHHSEVSAKEGKKKDQTEYMCLTHNESGEFSITLGKVRSFSHCIKVLMESASPMTFPHRATADPTDPTNHISPADCIKVDPLS